jgi:UDP-glucose 4-epimerase
VNTLGWKINYGLEDMMATAWKWEQKLKNDEHFYHPKSGGLN